MGLARPRLVAVLACAIALLLVAGGGDAFAAKKPTAKSALKALVKRSCECEQAPETLRTTIMSRISMTVIRVEGF